MRTRPTSRPKGPRSSNKSISRIVAKRLPPLEGRDIQVRFRPALSVKGGRLYSDHESGQPVHAATHVRSREIILEQELREQPKELARILTHELFHFVWVRLSNKLRKSYEAVVLKEWQHHARGELGWSAESRKRQLSFHHLPPTTHHPSFRTYLCESFCDTAAWLYSGVTRHEEFTLAARHRKRRAEWFREAFRDRGIPI